MMANEKREDEILVKDNPYSILHEHLIEPETPPQLKVVGGRNSPDEQ